ncbi:coiled-coil domain-containing protein 177-like [Dreissena polymorpha]|uniref:coiled-coil domain-containing protein 177-like n=1 Tax=Dreissena polymorpha TaxID=45954 RepID=UPI0022654CFD|nr:coiled-coil domain-containing protein 177-like [Dreissena polymorpha]XP_052245913.1 coiled-coil domain-containing protein 177-like [Dreissena polymorpha]
MTQETDDAMPCIDLMNFEDPQFEEGKYVLTSPRSLEACSRLGVKPVDLLYKPLAEFQEELLPQDVPLRTIYNIYDEHEHNRERKLALCREERIRIMEGEKGTTSGKPTVTKSKKTPSAVPKTQTRRSKLASKRSQSAENLGSGSLQRQRTAWATSVGHDRITNDEINQRVKDLHNESMKLRSELLSRKEARATSKRSNKKTRPATARTSTRKKTNISRSYSASDLSLAGTSMLSRSGTADARPITSSRLKKVLKNEAKNAPITPTDEKILELMYMKGEGEKIEARERQLREIQWERQKQEAEAIRLAGEMRRRRMLAEENRIQKLKKCEAELQHKAEEQRLQEKQEQLLNETSRRWRTRYLTVQKTQALKSIEKVEKEQLKKRIQENNVRALEAEEEEMKELVRQKQGRQILTAAQKKEAKLLEESMRVMMNNRSERRNFEDRWNSLLKDTQESIDLLLESMNAKDQKHKSKYEQLQQRRENEITLNRLDREKRALQAKLSQQQHENEMEEWRDNIMSSREIAERHATETLAETIERKARKAHEERVRKEKEQQKNIKKIHQEISQWKKSQESLIQLKDKKSDLIQQEKELTIQQSRHVAASGQKLRDSLRNKLGGETFDKMAIKAEMYNKFEMGNTFFSAEKNTSHVKLH